MKTQNTGGDASRFWKYEKLIIAFLSEYNETWNAFAFREILKDIYSDFENMRHWIAFTFDRIWDYWWMLEYGIELHLPLFSQNTTQLEDVQVSWFWTERSQLSKDIFCPLRTPLRTFQWLWGFRTCWSVAEPSEENLVTIHM